MRAHSPAATQQRAVDTALIKHRPDRSLEVTATVSEVSTVLLLARVHNESSK